MDGRAEMGVTGVPEIDESTALYIVGSDEVGYGAWAGPLTVCATIVSKDWPLAHLAKDSKAFKTEATREAACKKIFGTLLYEIINVPPTEIDRLGVYKAVQLAHREAIDKVLKKHHDTGCTGEILVVVDGNLPIPDAISLPKADTLVPAVSAASIIAKVWRDRHMRKMEAEYPGYDFAGSKGYGTPAHQQGLEKLGPCELHRKSYAPIAALIEARQVRKDEPQAWELLPGDD